MTARRLLMVAGGGRAFTPPPAPTWYASAHNDDYAGGGSFDNYIHVFTSADGLTWTKVGDHDISGTIISATAERDPHLLYRGGVWWICATGSDNTGFRLFTSAAFATGWAYDSSVATASATAHWAPQWFVDTDDTLYVVFSPLIGTRKLYYVESLAPDMSSWGTPTQFSGTGFATNSIDPNLTYWDGTYYLLWKDDDAGTICLSTSSAPFSGYTLQESGDWAGWKDGSGSIEGPIIVDIGTGWRVYFTHNSGFDAVAVYYSETTDRTMATGWSARTALSDFDGYNHPLPILV